MFVGRAEGDVVAAVRPAGARRKAGGGKRPRGIQGWRAAGSDGLAGRLRPLPEERGGQARAVAGGSSVRLAVVPDGVALADTAALPMAGITAPRSLLGPRVPGAGCRVPMSGACSPREALRNPRRPVGARRGVG
ncbi:hypothetical protein ACZ91_20910 [Streptomyces regensis]|nr:hypothetical protein ACZ91_20910 [Streptomyces regensis]